MSSYIVHPIKFQHLLQFLEVNTAKFQILFLLQVKNQIMANQRILLLLQLTQIV